MPRPPLRRAATLAAAAITLLPSRLIGQTVPMPAPPAEMAPLPDLGVEWPVLAPDPAPAAATRADPEAARRYRVEIEGTDALPDFRTRFAASSALLAGAGKPANAAQLDRRARDDEALALQLLRALGRYEGTAAAAIEPQGGDTLVRLRVEPGPAFAFAGVDLPGLPADLRAAFAVSAGDPVDADRVTAAVAGLRIALSNAGYPFARIPDPQVTIDHATREAKLLLPVSPGERARFGAIHVTGARPVFSAHHVTDIARFAPGDTYQASGLEDLRRALIQTGLVSVATVTPQPTARPGIVDVSVRLEPAPPRTIAGELGYGTGEGARAEVSWQHRNLLPPEGAVTFRGVLGTREQALSAVLRRGNFHARDRVLNAQVTAAHRRFDAFDARTFALSAGLERQSNIIFQKRWTWSGGAEFVATDERDTIQATGESRRRTFLVAALPGSLGYDSTNDLLDPVRGFRLLGRASPELSLQNGANGYVRLQLDASSYLPVTAKVTLAGRLRFAAITGAARDDIAPSRRLYAGGGGSVRGFGYQKIGPEDVDGDPVGGRGLAEAAIEARIRFGSFGIVPFLDAGSLNQAPRPRFADVRFGTGLGARYYSPFGPIRIDVGTPLGRRRGESRVAVYVSLGQAF